MKKNSKAKRSRTGRTGRTSPTTWSTREMADFIQQEMKERFSNVELRMRLELEAYVRGKIEEAESRRRRQEEQDEYTRVCQALAQWESVFPGKSAASVKEELRELRQKDLQAEKSEN